MYENIFLSKLYACPFWLSPYCLSLFVFDWPLKLSNPCTNFSSFISPLLWVNTYVIFQNFYIGMELLTWLTSILFYWLVVVLKIKVCCKFMTTALFLNDRQEDSTLISDCLPKTTSPIYYYAIKFQFAGSRHVATNYNHELVRTILTRF